MEGPAAAVSGAEGELQDLEHDRVIQHHDRAVHGTHTHRHISQWQSTRECQQPGHSKLPALPSPIRLHQMP